MNEDERTAYRMAAECTLPLKRALQFIKDRYLRGELIVPERPRRGW